MPTDVIKSSYADLGTFMVSHPLYQFRKTQGNGYRLRVLLAAEGQHLTDALMEILPNGQLLDTRLEVTVCSKTAYADGLALLESAPTLKRFTWIHGLGISSQPEDTLAELTFSPDLTPEELAGQKDLWDYVLIYGGAENPYRRAVEAWDYDPCRLAAFAEAGQISAVSSNRHPLPEGELPDEALLNRIAFNIHYGYQKYTQPRATLQEIREEFDRYYNQRSSLKNVRHIRSKLACCGIFDSDPAAAASQFASLIRSKPEIVGQLAVVEHNRWILEKAMQGYQLPKETDKLYYRANESTYSETGRWHVCLLPCDYTHRLVHTDWRTTENTCRPELDALDKKSLEVHRISKEAAYCNRSVIFQLLNFCGQLLDQITAGDMDLTARANAYLNSIHNAVSQMYQKKRIAAYRYDKSKQSLLALLSPGSSIAHDQIRTHLKDVDLYLKPLRDYIIDKDHKELDYLMVQQIPFALTRKHRPVLVKFFDVTDSDCQFAPWQMEPSEVTSLAFANTCEELDTLKKKAAYIHRFFQYSCNTVECRFHILVPASVLSEPGTASGEAEITIHSLPTGSQEEILALLRSLLAQRKPDYMEMTSVSPTLHGAAETCAREMQIGTFHVRGSSIYSLRGAEELEYPAPTKGITVREMFEQKGAVLVSCESSHMSDLSNVYRKFWEVSQNADNWKEFCAFISACYHAQKADRKYMLHAQHQSGQLFTHTVRLHANVQAKLLPVIRELESVGYMQNVRLNWFVGDVMDLSFQVHGSSAAQKLADALTEINAEHTHNDCYDIKWLSGRPTIQTRQLKIRSASLPAGQESEYRKILDALCAAGVLTNLRYRSGQVSFDFTAVEFLTALRNSGKVLEYYLYYTALQECQFDDAEMSWMFFHSAETYAAKNELDVICTKGTTSLFISAKNVKPDTFDDPKFLNYVCYEVATLAESFGIHAKTVLAAPNVAQFEGNRRSRLVDRAMSRNVYLLGDKCFEPGNLSLVLDNISRGEKDWCEFML